MKKYHIFIAAFIIFSNTAYGQYIDDNLYESKDPYGSTNDSIYYSESQKKAILKEQKQKELIEEQRRRDFEAKAKAEAAAREKARLEAEAKAKAEAAAREKARLEAEAKAKAEAAAREKARLEAEAKAKAKAEAREKARLANKEKMHNNRFRDAAIGVGISGSIAGGLTATLLYLQAKKYAEVSKDRSFWPTQISVNKMGTRSRHYEIGAWSAIGFGAVSVATSVALGIVHQKSKKSQTKNKVEISPTAFNDGAMLSFSGSW